MQVFVINLDSAPERWAYAHAGFTATGLPIQRVAAVDGSGIQLPVRDYAEARFHWCHGRATNLREIGCYLSHLKAMEAFLQTSDSHGLICEDDVAPSPCLNVILKAALRYAGGWNILRLCALGRGVPRRVHSLSPGFELCVSLGRLKGAGAYVVDRRAAETLVHALRPMWLPFDHALDREWFHRLRAAYILPFPCSQTSSWFRSSIQKGRTGKRRSRHRWLTTYPYQAGNEMARWLWRTMSYLRFDRHGLG